MTLSIITINYNNKEGLQKTIKSVVSQTVKEFEWVVIDGGSTDGSKELIEKYSNYIDYYVSEPDKGIYNAMNKGIHASHGDFLQFLNSGDSLHENDTIERVLPLLKDTDIYVGRINSLGRENASIAEQEDFSPSAILHKLTFTWIPHQASFINRCVFEKYGLYREDKRIVSDWWAYYRSIVIGNATIESIPITIADYDINGISATHRTKAIAEQESLLHEYPAISEYYHFYKENKDIIDSLKSNKFAFMLFRVYFYIYRKLHNL